MPCELLPGKYMLDAIGSKGGLTAALPRNPFIQCNRLFGLQDAILSILSLFAHGELIPLH